ncbi:MAG: HAD hydrolase family protein [Clostridia bacterium]|nr:HAD hydrolase family protein [Clostridia bacterium]
MSFFRNGNCIEISPYGVTKATSIHQLIQKYNNANVFTLGDNVTDIPMIQEFYGFAVENACQELKDASLHHCNRVHNVINFVLDNF